MKQPPSIADMLELTLADRLRFVEDLWDSIAAVPESVPLTDRQKEELDRRVAAFHDDPEAGSPWDDVKARIRQGA